MLVNSEEPSHAGFDNSDHQTSYVFSPLTNLDGQPERPQKRRKISKQGGESTSSPNVGQSIHFPALFGGIESSKCVEVRQRLYEESWKKTEARIETILRDANEVTLRNVTAFVFEEIPDEHKEQIPAGLIVTGPNIASQELLFGQLATHLRSATDNIVVTLRSGDAPNLKTVLKKVIRDAASSKPDPDDDGQILSQKDGRKLMNYDLQVLANHVSSLPSCKVIVAFQDSEAFDSNLLAEMLDLFSSWINRIRFVVLFGIATSIELFHERLPRSATKSLYGAQFDVEQTSKTLRKVFNRAVAGNDTALYLGSGIITSLLERQHDQVQSVQAFVSALKYAYMCHFYGNPLSVLFHGSYNSNPGAERMDLLQAEHLEAIRMLPSFRKRIETALENGEFAHAKALLSSDEALIEEVCKALYNEHEGSSASITRLLQDLQLLNSSASVVVEPAELYIGAFSGTLNDTNVTEDLLASVKHMNVLEVEEFLQTFLGTIATGDPESGLDPWDKNGTEPFALELSHCLSKIDSLKETAEDEGITLRSRYALQNTSLRTTVIAQKVQLSKAESALSRFDVEFTGIIDEICDLLENHFVFENPQDMFLNEIWLYDSKSPYREVFTPKPRQALERALCVPHDYLGCTCCRASEEGLSASQPPTAILYQLYLETGGLINVFDLWSAFFAIVGGEDREDRDERGALMLFYRALADLKLLGMVKPSRKKTDHLAKMAWKGL